ncbi:hypothetical protein G647_00388 [Cladophialophora carrionii CBS 160.54]|uniref:Uncharacterized protein n=1 Tax=Cladophialophora carrionii CBS 160.54 TaxID=1279043 RepID=V9DM06_9EURO|nr:uncharacterized protein G647_00388 [Cladophialophora carrionii CBS 160.54]ETI27939.1 hypothetical protein G647_00388 [Cladophialophora carrionii CBS 160.54]
MCSHLNTLIPASIATDLHQDFWRHRRGCARCDGKHTPNSHEYQTAKCCLEHLIKNRDVLYKPRKGAKAVDDKPGKSARPKKPLSEAQRERLRRKRHEAKLARGYICREYEMDDDFDAGGEKTGQLTHAYFKDHRAKAYDEEAVVVMEEDDSIYEQLVVCTKKILI